MKKFLFFAILIVSSCGPLSGISAAAQQKEAPEVICEGGICLLKPRTARPSRRSPAINDPRKMFKRKLLLSKKLELIKKKDPELYEQICRKIQKEKRRKWMRMKQRDPEKFKQIMQRRKLVFQAHLAQLKQLDPEKYRRVQEKINQLREYFRLKKESPAEAENYLDNRPQLKKFLNQRASRGND